MTLSLGQRIDDIACIDDIAHTKPTQIIPELKRRSAALLRRVGIRIDDIFP
jgi:hypothetical protein